MRAPPAGRPTQELDRPLLFFNTVGTHVFILDFGACVSEVVRGSGTSLSLFVLSSLLPIPSLLSSVLFRLRPVVLCTTHTGCLLNTTVVLCTIEAGAATDLPDPNVFRSRLPAFLSSFPSITSLVLLVPTDMSSRAVVLCTTHTS